MSTDRPIYRFHLDQESDTEVAASDYLRELPARSRNQFIRYAVILAHRLIEGETDPVVWMQKLLTPPDQLFGGTGKKISSDRPLSDSEIVVTSADMAMSNATSEQDAETLDYAIEQNQSKRSETLKESATSVSAKSFSPSEDSTDDVSDQSEDADDSKEATAESEEQQVSFDPTKPSAVMSRFLRTSDTS